MTTTIKDSRSGLQSENLQEIVDASVSAKHATLNGSQQYQTPVPFATFLASLLPAAPDVVFDPQCAAGNLVKSGQSYYAEQFGFELDNRYRDTADGVHRLTGNCVKLWEILDDLFPDLKWECQLANPPFGLLWKVGDDKVDSTEFTWRKIQERASEAGHGFFIANHKTIERLGIDKHERVYLYQKFPAGIWKNCDVEVGVVHWCVLPVEKFGKLVYQTLDFNEHRTTLAAVRSSLADHYESGSFTPAYEIKKAFAIIEEVLEEERKKRSEFNISLAPDGKLKVYLSTRTQVKRKLGRDEVLRVATVHNCHPITLTTDRETRKLLAELVTCGFYTIQPAAKEAIEAALTEANNAAVPLMPVTDFERVSYADEEDNLECIASGGLRFTPGQSYEMTTASYQWSGTFTRDKVHYSELEGTMYTAKHRCELSGTDRYIQVTDDDGETHRFMDKPQSPRDHDESLLWKIFKAPVVNTVAETKPDAVKLNLAMMDSCEALAGFTFYNGQRHYYSRVAVKDAALVGADVGTGKTVGALTLIQLKAPYRALIIAPQGTMRSNEDEEEGEEFQASHWVQGIRQFSPGLQVFELFNMEDYHRIKRANDGVLPAGVFISYYQAMFSNGARERVPDTWNDTRLLKECRNILGVKVEPNIWPPEDEEVTDKYWCNTVGHEKNGIHCIITPCMITLIGKDFDMVIVDECHIANNLDANVSQMLIRLQPRYRYALSATPITNIVSNLFSLMGWLCVQDWYRGERRNVAWPYSRDEIGRFNDTFLSFERDHTQEEINQAAARRNGGRFSGKCIKVSPVISSPARLLKLLKPTMAYISKEQCNADYKPAKFIDVRVPMGTQQAKLYQHFLNRGNIPASNPLVRARKQSIYLRNICADPAGFNHGGPSCKSNFNPKTFAILDIVRQILARGEQVVIVNARVGQTESIAMKLREAGVRCARVDSTVSAENHAYQSNLFKSKKAPVMLMGIKCAMGHSYPDCPNLIIGSLEWSSGSKHQAAGRVDRVNSKQQATIYCILHQKSIEEYMYDVVATKGDAAELCMKGKRTPRDFKPVDMSEVLAMAITGFNTDGTVDERTVENDWPELRKSFSKA